MVFFFFFFFVGPLAFPHISKILATQTISVSFPYTFNQVVGSQERKLTTSRTMVRAVSSAKVQCQIITGSEGFSLSDLGRVSIPPICSRIYGCSLSTCWLVLDRKTEILVEINSLLLSRFLSRTKELIPEERTARES